MKADSTNGSISVEQGPRSISAIQRRRCSWILVPLISAILTVPCLASVCAGVSIERAFDQADVVIEAKLNTKIPPDKLQNPATEKEEILYLPVGLTFDVLTVWKGNKTETALIYIYSLYTGFDDDQTYLIFATRNFDIQSRKRQYELDEIPITNLRLFTSGCTGNAILREDRASQLAREKLDRMKEDHIDYVAQSERTEALQERIRGIVKSSKNVTPAREE